MGDSPEGANTALNVRVPQAVVEYLDDVAEVEKRKRSNTACLMLEERIALHRVGFDLNDRDMLRLLMTVTALEEKYLDELKVFLRNLGSKEVSGSSPNRVKRAGGGRK